MARRLVDVIALLSAYGNRLKTGYRVVDASIEDGVSATLMGGGIQTFTSVFTDKTFADIETSPTAHVENLPLPMRIPPNGGSQRIKLVVPIDQLLNPESLQIRVGYKLKKLDAAVAAQDIVLTDAILSPGGAYCIRKVDVIINIKMQFGSSVNRGYGPERRRMEILRGIGPAVDDLEETFNRYNGFVPNVQTYAENVAGKYQEDAGVVTAVQSHTANMRDSTTNYCRALQERNTRRLLEGKEVFNMVETADEGILGATKLFPGVITELALILQYKSILEMFAEEKHSVNTDAISSAFLEITTVTVSKQCGVPSTSQWGTLHNAATAGGGKANLPSYPTKVVDVYNGPRSFPATSMVLAVPIPGVKCQTVSIYASEINVICLLREAHRPI